MSVENVISAITNAVEHARSNARVQYPNLNDFEIDTLIIIALICSTIVQQAQTMQADLSRRSIIQTKEINCYVCKTRNSIPLANKPAFHCENDCCVCLNRKASIYQPQCGHILLCETCFKNNA